MQDAMLRLDSAEFLARVSDIIDTGIARTMDETIKPAAINPVMDCGCAMCTLM
jgi:hypothetical protein